MGTVIPDLLSGALVTVEVTMGAWCLAVALGLLIAVARELSGRATRFMLLAAVASLRSLPELVLLYLVFFGLGAFLPIGPVVAAILALGVTDAAFVSEYYRAGFLTVPQTQREAGASLGLSRLAVLRRIVLPQAIPTVLPPLVNSFAGLLKTATLASAIGAGEVLNHAMTIMNLTGQINLVMTTVVILYLMVTIPITRLAGLLERRVRTQAAA